MKRSAVVLMALAGSIALAQGGSSGVGSAGAPVPGAAARGAAPAFKAHVLSRGELDALLAQPDKILVIDVRRPDEVSSKGGLPVYLSIQIKDLEKSLAWIPKGRSIVTVSNHAARAGRAADLLVSKGFKVAGAAGVQTYEQQGGTLTHVQVPVRAAAAAGAAN